MISGSVVSGTAPPAPQGLGMFGLQGCERHRTVDGTGDSGSGRPGDVEPPAAGEGQAVSRAGAHRLRGERLFLRPNWGPTNGNHSEVGFRCELCDIQEPDLE